MIRKFAGVLLSVLAVAALSPAPARAAGGGYVRLAHLSPDTPAVDVYLRAEAGTPEPQRFDGVAYGALSDYLRLPAGNYTVAMRKAGAAESTPPVITTQVTVTDGGAYTVAGVGRYADLGLRVLEDDLRLPGSGTSKIRIVQASVRAPVLDVAVRNGRDIAGAVRFATTTSYREVNPGQWTVQVKPTGGGSTSDLPCTLAPGNVYSLLVLDDGKGGLAPQLHLDAARQGGIPRGGVATGGGGSAGTGFPPEAALVGLLAVVLLTARRRARAR